MYIVDIIIVNYNEIVWVFIKDCKYIIIIYKIVWYNI